MKRRNFLSSLLTSGAAAAVLGSVGTAAYANPSATPSQESDADVVLRPGREIELAGRAKLGHVELRGGSITTSEGGVFEIASLRKG